MAMHIVEKREEQDETQMVVHFAKLYRSIFWVLSKIVE
jgi:hypothetical protein